MYICSTNDMRYTVTLLRYMLVIGRKHTELSQYCRGRLNGYFIQ